MSGPETSPDRPQTRLWSPVHQWRSPPPPAGPRTGPGRLPSPGLPQPLLQVPVSSNIIIVINVIIINVIIVIIIIIINIIIINVIAIITIIINVIIIIIIIIIIMFFIILMLELTRRSNTSSQDFPREGRVEIRARRDIMAGEEITTSYMRPRQDTQSRRQLLAHTWHFWCECELCRDPSEGGTNLSALVCVGCGESSMLPEDPLDLETCWTCSDCGATISQEEHEAILSQTIEVNRSTGGRTLLIIAPDHQQFSKRKYQQRAA